MLDTQTKRRIDEARDILVGKVPDPKSQVEQITIALIYKFMDDMDAESEEMGGARKFFAGDFSRFGWAKLMSPGLGGHAVLNLYAEAIQRMPENPGVPPLFREIFKNAFLPYRDPETLRAFLKTIDGFTYDHSERLGDAFEYLLSVLGSQGDAGQFRTPRHIIDFIVAIVDPHKGEKVLDPACGTAGFLISAYKHILRANTDARGNSTLTPDERAGLARNFTGYDISPDMVRLSLVNMYLHGFVAPNIHEYDTLTSEERWNEAADVILANPPFMSPKGGIRPHTRFSVQSKRSEVLFVDYMAEHLTPAGRAGIIVPEGVIFQSQGSYKQLRKLLVEGFLVAVISLPAGVFNPYSGVKTSILILDRALARSSETVAFFTAASDGFGLGAQRRAVATNDLPAVTAEIEVYLAALRAGQSGTDVPLAHGIVVPKEKIAANGDYNLSGERYRVAAIRRSTFPLVPLEEVFTRIKNGANVIQQDDVARHRVSRIQSISTGAFDLAKTKYTEDEVRGDQLLQTGDILLSHINSFEQLGKTAIFLEQEASVVHGINLIRLVPDTARIDPRYIIRIFKTANFIDKVKSFAQKAVNQASVKTSDLRRICVPVPPIDVQREIVAEIEGYQKVIDGARAVVEGYRPHIVIDPNWPQEALGEHFTTISGGTPSKAEASFWNGRIPWVSPKDMKSDRITDTEDHISDEAIASTATKLIPGGNVVCVVRSGILKHTFPVALLDREMCINQDLVAFLPTSLDVSSPFLFYVLKASAADILGQGIKPGVTVQSFHSGFFRSFVIPVPPLATQCAIVAEIEAEQALVDANRELIARFERKIQATLARVWGDETAAVAVGGTTAEAADD